MVRFGLSIRIIEPPLTPVRLMHTLTGTIQPSDGGIGRWAMPPTPTGGKMQSGRYGYGQTEFFKKQPDGFPGVLAHDVPAVLADSWQDNLSHPVLEHLGLGLVTPHDQFVEATLGDQGRHRTAHTLYPMKGFLSVTQGTDGVGRVGDRQRPADMRRDEPRFPLDLDGTDGQVV